MSSADDRTKRTPSAWLYARLMGVPRARLVDTGHSPSLRTVLYYAYERGFWSAARGLAMRPRLRHSAGRFFLGRHCRVLFPGHLSVGRNVAIGDFTYISCYGTRGVELASDVRIREFGWIQVTSHLTAPGVGLSIGERTYIGPHSVLGAAGGITIGRDVTFGAYVQLLAEDHRFVELARPLNEQGVTRQGITIGDDCWLGNGVIVVDGVRIGDGVVVGAGSVVTRDLPARTVAVGNPARVIREREGN